MGSGRRPESASHRSEEFFPNVRKQETMQEHFSNPKSVQQTLETIERDINSVHDNSQDDRLRGDDRNDQMQEIIKSIENRLENGEKTLVQLARHLRETRESVNQLKEMVE